MFDSTLGKCLSLASTCTYRVAALCSDNKQAKLLVHNMIETRVAVVPPSRVENRLMINSPCAVAASPLIASTPMPPTISQIITK
ncbi:hypothetical protein D3C86_1636440 [compost metagenome]